MLHILSSLSMILRKKYKLSLKKYVSLSASLPVCNHLQEASEFSWVPKPVKILQVWIVLYKQN